MVIKLLCMLFFSIGIARGTPTPKCPSEKICGNVGESKEVCILDENENCIRKYKSSCHMAIAGCRYPNLASIFQNLPTTATSTAAWKVGYAKSHLTNAGRSSLAKRMS
ncbi:uncharacterized protein LOC108052641 isoform X1 [Drosophila rhopaloa]|uniref:Uncharacterized protein LOC108052641 isoform X1 n=1 Tax=Drosophila rhopaloa TaxID=1041015 RepID=A0A6P4FZG7_DRORH|nr:uncharacterized protein LOC108052641 isoform X1 [Drosophila rhopaloa]